MPCKSQRVSATRRAHIVSRVSNRIHGMGSNVIDPVEGEGLINHEEKVAPIWPCQHGAGDWDLHQAKSLTTLWASSFTQTLKRTSAEPASHLQTCIHAAW